MQKRANTNEVVNEMQIVVMIKIILGTLVQLRWNTEQVFQESVTDSCNKSVTLVSIFDSGF